MKKHPIQKTLILLLAITIIIQGCKKENDAKLPKTEAESSRLAFNSNKEFESLMSKLVKEKDSEIGGIIKKYSENSNFRSFYEVQKSNIQSKISVTSSNEINDDEVEEDPFDNLVPDPYFASVLDSNLEVSVENII